MMRGRRRHIAARAIVDGVGGKEVEWDRDSRTPRQIRVD